MPRTKEEKNAYMKEWRKRNKERVAEANRIWYENNKENVLERHKQWRQTPAGRKSITIQNWKTEGLIDSDGDNYKKRYEAYLQATNCEVCKCEFKNSYDRCMDRNHDTNLFRQFLCQSCNRFDRWKKKLSTAS
jgi:hypothetical protein